MENYNTEKEIINNFIKKNKRDRIIWELTNPSKREMIFWRFAHPDLFDANCLHAMEYMDSNRLYEHLLEASGNLNAYFMGESYIGELSLKKAIKLVESGEICIVYCGNGIGYYQGESDMGNRKRYMLEKVYKCG